MFAEWKRAPLSPAPLRSAFLRSAQKRCVRKRAAFRRFASLRFTPSRFAPLRFASRFAPLRSGWIEGFFSLQAFQASTPCWSIFRWSVFTFETPLRGKASAAEGHFHPYAASSAIGCSKRRAEKRSAFRHSLSSAYRAAADRITARPSLAAHPCCPSTPPGTTRRRHSEERRNTATRLGARPNRASLG